MSRASLFALFSFLLAVAGGAFLWWRSRAPAPVVARAPVAAPAPPAPPAPPPAAAPTVRYPVPPARSPHPLSLEDADARVKSALVDLLGNKAVRSFLRLDDVLRKFVATVDNLATDNATAQMWPVSQTRVALTPRPVTAPSRSAPRTRTATRPSCTWSKVSTRGRPVRALLSTLAARL